MWLQLASGTLLSARFCAADVWNAPLPRLEVCGTDGRFLVCEGGRRLWQHEPQSAARLVEPPLSSPRLFGAGVTEDARTFFALAAQKVFAGNASAGSGAAPGATSHNASAIYAASPYAAAHNATSQSADAYFASTRAAAEISASDATRHHDLASAIRALRLLEAAAQCAHDHRFVTLQRDGALPQTAPRDDDESAARQRATLAKNAPPLFAVPPKNARDDEEKVRRESAAISAEAASHLTLPW